MKKIVLGLFAFIALSFLSIDSAKAESPFIGLQIQELSPKIVQAMDVSVEKGLLVRDIAFPGPATNSGLLRGDIIVKVDGTDTPDVATVVNLMKTLLPGQTVPVEVFRLGKTITLEVEIALKPDSWSVTRNKFATIPALGLTFAAITPKVRERFNVEWNVRGVVITLLDEAKGGALDLNEGDVILQVNQRPVWSPDHIVAYIKKAQSLEKETVLLLVKGAGGYRFALLPVPKT